MQEQLPKGWRSVKLGEVATYINGKAFKPSEWSKEGLPIIRIQNLNKIKAEFNYCNFKIDEKFVVNKGDLLFAWSGTPDTSFGAHIWKGNKAVLNQHIFKILIDTKIIDKQYYLYALNHKVKEFVSKSHGTAGLAHITKKKFEDSEIYLPSLPTQLAIVSKIEELFSELDKGIENLRTAQQQLKTYRQAVLKWAFEGKLTNSLNHDAVDAYDENELSMAAEPIVTYKAKNNNGSDKGELPEGWKWVQIKDVTQMNPKIPDRESIDRQMDVQFLPMKLVEETINKIHLTEIRKYEDVLKGSYTPFVDGDVIFAKVTPCMENGKIAIVNNLKNGIGFGSSEFHVMRVGINLNREFLFYYLIQDSFRHEAANEMTGAVGLRRVPKQFIENHTIPLAPIEEQNKIVQEIESRLSVADKMEEGITQSLQLAEALRQSILKRAFEGKILIV